MTSDPQNLFPYHWKSVPFDWYLPISLTTIPLSGMIFFFFNKTEKSYFFILQSLINYINFIGLHYKIQFSFTSSSICQYTCHCWQLKIIPSILSVSKVNGKEHRQWGVFSPKLFALTFPIFTMAEGEHVLAIHLSRCVSLCIHFCGWHMCSFRKVVILIKQNIQKGSSGRSICIFCIYLYINE